MNGFGQRMSIGDPKLPVLKQLIEIPLNAQVEINIINQDYTDYYLADFGIINRLFPTQAPVSKDEEAVTEFVLNQSTYQIDDFIANQLVFAKELGMMRGVKLARLEVSPLQYNPVQNKIRIYHSMEFAVTFVGGNTSATKEMKSKYFSPYFESTYKLLSNYKSIESDELIMDEPVTYIIVSDPMFQAALQPFIQWKTQKGFYVIEAYTDDPAVGTTTTSIQSYLQGIYNSPPAGYNPQSFVLFVGDVAQIPTFNGTAGSHVTDLYYCEYTGDLFPECYYGRFSATNLTELQPQIDKTLEYEQYLMPDPSFLDEVVMVAGADASHSSTWGNGQINYGTINYFNLAHGLTSHTYLQPEPGGANYSQSIRDDVSNGVSYANYTAHCSPSGWGDPSFVMSHIPALTNDHKYPLMIGNCCSSVEFQTDCFGEEILRAANKGALGYIGGSNSTYWDEDFWWGVGFEAISAHPTYNPANLGAYDRTFHDNGEILNEWFVTQGQMPAAGNLAITQSGSSSETYYWEIYHLMGDPSLMVYFSQPPVTTAVYDPLMPLSSTSFIVNTDPYAYVSITKDGVLYGAAIADATGLATVSLDPITVPGNADVVVTRQNGQPYIGTVLVASPSGPYVLLDDFQIDDAAGNNNGQIDYGENILLDVTLENVGSSAANNVSVILSTTDTYVTITDDTQAWPSIPSNATSSQIGAFAFTVADDVPDQHMVAFDLTITGTTDDTWNSTINVTINAPLLEAGNMTIDDMTGGNGNGRLDPGETVDLYIETLNNGNSNSPFAATTLTSTNQYVTVISGAYDLGIINAASSSDAIFSISIDPTAPIGEVVDLYYDLTAGAYPLNNMFYQSVGLILEDWETGDFSRFYWGFDGDADWAIDQSDPYEGIYCAKSGAIGDNSTTSLSLQVDVASAGDISFFRKVSSESGYDYLKFYIDGSMKEQWSGTVAWGEVIYAVTPGIHKFTWTYEKDANTVGGSDCGWIDYIIFPPLGAEIPTMTISTDSIDFENVFMGDAYTKTFTITNSGTGPLTGDMTTPGTVFSVGGTDGKNTYTYSVMPGITKEFFVTFAPAAIQNYSGLMTITNNTGVGDETIFLNGSGISGLMPPYSQDFEEAGNWPYAWSNIASNDDFDWTINQGGTPSSSTGPSGDHTTGNGWYIYTESSSPYYPAYLAIVELPVFDFTNFSGVEIRFWYHMYGTAMGSLHLDAFVDGVWIDDVMTTLSGNAGNTWNENIVDFSAYAGKIVKLRFRGITGTSYTSDMAIDDFSVIATGAPAIAIDMKAFMEGPYNGTGMNTVLNSNGDIPLAQPFNTAPWNYTGLETVTSVPNADIVDWVLIELRETAGGASTATSSTMIGQQAVFVKSDGSIVDLDGTSDPQFSLSVTDDIYMVIWHRCHLGIMSANALTQTGGVYTYDFSSGLGQVYGSITAHKDLGGGVYGMIGGDGNSDGQVGTPDKVDIWSVQVGNSGYLMSDFDMDGNVGNQDKVDIWMPNAGSGGQVPDILTYTGYKCMVP